MDTKSWDEFAGLFTADATFDVRGALEMPKSEQEYAASLSSRGATQYFDYVRTGLTPLVSVHHGHMPEITISSPTTASAIWAMDDLLVPPAGGPFRIFRGYGHYRETYVREETTWRIATLQLRRLYVETA